MYTLHPCQMYAMREPVALSETASLLSHLPHLVSLNASRQPGPPCPCLGGLDIPSCQARCPAGATLDAGLALKGNLWDLSISWTALVASSVSVVHVVCERRRRASCKDTHQPLLTTRRSVSHRRTRCLRDPCCAHGQNRCTVMHRLSVRSMSCVMKVRRDEEDAQVYS
jgi:hypothetical protein